MKPFTLATILLSAVVGLRTVETKAEVMPFYETNQVSGQTEFTDFWNHGGQKIGWNGGAESGWVYSHNTLENGNGVEMRLSGPESGNSYGSEAWVTTTRDFNDGNEWMINFSWQAVRNDPNNNRVLFQITDGYIDPAQWIYWECRNIPGTTILLSDKDRGVPEASEYYMALQSTGLFPDNIAHWSIDINQNGTARLYDQSNLQGNLLTEKNIDKAFPWHFRLMNKDGTSSGYCAGDFRLDVYDVSASQIPEPSSLVLLVGAGIGTLGYLGSRQRKESGKN